MAAINTFRPGTSYTADVVHDPYGQRTARIVAAACVLLALAAIAAPWLLTEWHREHVTARIERLW